MRTLRTLILALVPGAIALAQTITSTSPLPNGTVNVPYSNQLICTNCTGGVWAVSSGSLPPVLALNPSTRVISGTPTTAATYNFQISMSLIGAGTATKNFSLTIIPPVAINQTSIPNGVQGSAYSTTITASGGTPPYFWSMLSPNSDGLTINGNTGVISGTPTAAGQFTLNVTVSDSNSGVASRSFTLTVAPPPIITTSSLPNGTVNQPYSAQETCTNCTGGSWSVSSGALPPVLSLNSQSGAITGTPATAATYNFQVTLTVPVAGGTPVVVTQTQSITITAGAAPLSVFTSFLPNGAVGTAYSQSLAATGGQPPYTWSLALGILPAGLTLNATNGVISGTPTALGNFGITVQVTDSTQASAQADLSIAVTVPPVTITTASLPNGAVGTAYSQPLAATGGQPPYTWSLALGILPAGLTLNAATGVINGTPTAAGTASFTVQALDSTDESYGQAALSIVVILPGFAITTASLPNGAVGTAYSQPLAATGGQPPYTWSLALGILPAGLTLNAATGVINGTPTVGGTSSFTVQASDSTGGSFAQKSLSIVVTGQGVSITTTTLPNGIVAQPYSAQLSCVNCSGYIWSVSSGSLPPGLSLNAQSGAITGTPSAAGTSSFQVSLTAPSTFNVPTIITQILSITIIMPPNLVIDQSTIPVGAQNRPYTTTLTGSGGAPPYSWSFLSTSNDGLTIGQSSGAISGSPPAAGQFELNVLLTDSTGLTAMKGFALIVAPPLSILTTSLPNGTLNAVYPTQTLSAGGGQPPYRWSISTGTLPPGLTLDGVFGRISGTPATTGFYAFTLAVKDNLADTASANLSIDVGGNITITPATLPAGAVGTAYQQALNATGGQAPYTWSLANGTLPAGLTLNAATGVISGTPTAAGTSSFTAQATDTAKVFGQVSLSITIAAPPTLTITTATLAHGTVGAPYSQTLAAAGGVPPYTWSLASGALPAGLTLSAAVISGTPTTAATSNFTVQVTDAAKTTAQQALSIVISAPLGFAPTTLPTAVVNVAYTQQLTGTGGVGPYTFALASGNLPSGFSLSAGTIMGTATAFPDSGNFTIMVTDSTGATFTQGLSLAAVLPPAPPVTVTITGPATSGFVQQLPLNIAIGTTFPVDIAGSITLIFAPSVTPANGVDDAMIQFSSGSRVINFTIPKGSTTPTLTNAGSITVLTGTTAGTITVTTDLTAGGSDLGKTTKTIVNASGVPFISSISFAQTPGGVTVTVVGFSSTRDMVSGLFHFAPATNVTFASSDITVQLASAFSTWWGNTTQSNPYGTQFTLTVPFSFSTQSAAVVSVTVTLTNSKGASNPVTMAQ